MNMNKKKSFENLIEEAKNFAKRSYEDYMKKWKSFNPKYKRKWIEHKQTDGSVMWALEGTPDKAFVWVDYESKKIVCLDSTGNKIKSLCL